MGKPSLMLEIYIPAPGLRPGAGFLHAYTESLIREIENCSGELAEYDIKTLYIRGASGPGDLDLRVLTRTLKQKLDIKDAEKVIEMEPERVTTANMSTYQNFRTDLYRFDLKALNYPDFCRLKLRYEHNRYTWLQKLLSYSNMKNVCIDLLYGIPRQTVPSTTDTLNRAMGFDPDKVCFMPYAGMETAGGEAGASETVGGGNAGNAAVSAAVEILEAADSYLSAKGYHRTSVYEYAKEGKDSLHTLLQHTDCEYWGLGVGAVSFLDGCVMANTSNPDAYISAAGDMEKLVTRAVRLDEKSLMKNLAIRNLNSAQGIEIKAFTDRFAHAFDPAVESLSEAGFASEKDGRFALTGLGVVNMPSVRKIISRL